MAYRNPLALTVIVCLVSFALACGGSAPPSEPMTSDEPEEMPATEPASGPLDDPIASTRSAAPESISANATVMDWDLNVVSEGTNEWTCLPDKPNTPGNDPWCVTDAWLNFLQAIVNQTEPT